MWVGRTRLEGARSSVASGFCGIREYRTLDVVVDNSVHVSDTRDGIGRSI